MERGCDVCGDLYEAKRPSSRFCSARCRNRKARGSAVLTKLPAAALEESTVSWVRAELKAAGRDETSLGAAAVQAAKRLDESSVMNGYAALLKEFRATMAAAMEGVGHDRDALTDIRSSAALKLIRPA